MEETRNGGIRGKGKGREEREAHLDILPTFPRNTITLPSLSMKCASAGEELDLGHQVRLVGIDEGCRVQLGVNRGRS